MKLLHFMKTLSGLSTLWLTARTVFLPQLGQCFNSGGMASSLFYTSPSLVELEITLEWVVARWRCMGSGGVGDKPLSLPDLKKEGGNL